MKRPTVMAGGAVLLLLSATLHAQWLNYPTPGIPRLPDGKVNLSAPAPRTGGRTAGSVRTLAREREIHIGFDGRGETGGGRVPPGD